MLPIQILLSLTLGSCPPAKITCCSSGDGAVAAIRIDGDPLQLPRRAKEIRLGITGAGEAVVIGGGVKPELMGLFLAATDGDEVVNLGHLRADGPWLGVQFGPVSKPVASHLKLDDNIGQMVLNVVRDSPADDIGLGQYDVIVEIDGESVSGDVEEFVNRLQDMDPGETHRLTYYHRGDRVEADVVIGTRPEKMGEYKYEFQPEVIAQNRVFDRLGMLEKGPRGVWNFRGLDLKDMPQFKMDLPDLKELENLKFDFKFDGDFPGFNRTFMRKMMRGKSIRVEIDEDGQITVTTTEDEDGERETTTKTYDSEEEFKKDNPEAFKLHNAGGHGGMSFGFSTNGDEPYSFAVPFGGTGNIDFVFPFGEKEGKSFKVWRQKLQDSTNNAVVEYRRRFGVKTDGDDDDAPRDTAFFGRPRTTFEVADDGKIRVITRQGNQEMIQSFGSAAAMKKARPDLHRKYEKLQ